MMRFAHICKHASSQHRRAFDQAASRRSTESIPTGPRHRRAAPTSGLRDAQADARRDLGHPRVERAHDELRIRRIAEVQGRGKVGGIERAASAERGRVDASRCLAKPRDSLAIALKFFSYYNSYIRLLSGSRRAPASEVTRRPRKVARLREKELQNLRPSWPFSRLNVAAGSAPH